MLFSLKKRKTFSETQTGAVNRDEVFTCAVIARKGNGHSILIAKPVSGAFEFPSSDIFCQNQVTFNLILGPTMYKHKPAGEIFNIRSELNNEFRW